MNSARCVLCMILAAILFGMTPRTGSATLNEHMNCPPIIIDVYAGEPVSEETMMDDLARARIVYLGELHTISRHHDLQYLILNNLYSKGLKLAVGMEMFSWTRQDPLNSWLHGDKDLGGLAKELGEESWKNISDYRKILDFARRNRIPVIALNAPDKVVRMVARGRIGELLEVERKRLPQDLDLVDPLYERLLRLRLRVHKAFEGKSLDNVIRAQMLRDGVMAENIVRFLRSSQGTDSAMVVIAGSGHMNYGFGIPERVRKKMNVLDRIVLPTESGQLILSEEEKRQAVPVEITHQDLSFLRVPIANYLHVLPLKHVPADKGVHAAGEETTRFMSCDTFQSSEE